MLLKVYAMLENVKMKRILSSFFLVLTILTSFAFGGATPTHANSLPCDKNNPSFLFRLWEGIKCAADINCTVRAASASALNYLVYMGVGEDFDKLTECDTKAMLQGQWDKGLASAAGKITTLALSSPSPLGGAGNFFKSELSDNLFNTQVRAESPGRIALLPVLPAWELMRNLAYGMFAVIMVAIGVMIILRKEISPRVVITFTSALPKIAIGLVLIAFSFPLIAFIVDVFTNYLSALILFVMGKAFIWTGTLPTPGGVGGELLSGLGGRIVGGLLAGLAYVAQAGVGMLSLMILFNLLQLVTIVFLLIFVFKLLLAYGWILVYTLFSPFFIVIGSLPGQEEMISSFAKRILAKALVLPTMLFFALLAGYFAIIQSFSPDTLTSFGGEGVAKFIIGPAFAAALGPLLAVLMLIMGIKAPAMIENALGVGAPPKKKK